MLKRLKNSQGFSTLELVTVIIIIGILAASSTTILIPSQTFQLQAARDQLVAAIEVAQQRAMSRQNAVRVVISGSQIDIQDDDDGDDDFSPNTSIFVGGVSYPLTLENNQTLSSATLVFNRLGETSGTSIGLSQGAASVTVVVTDSGYAY